MFFYSNLSFSFKCKAKVNCHSYSTVAALRRKFTQSINELQRQTHGVAACNVHTSVKHRKPLVFGIETSCDDTGAAVVNQDACVIGEALNSQTRIHVEMGGIIPPLARDLHQQNIQQVVNDALNNANITIKDVDAIAVTVKPGLALSLSVGLEYAKELAKHYGKPVIPIHHMEAHALTVRMIEKIGFPFLVLLASGGHCLLAMAKDIDDFSLIGKGIDDAPGDAYDKTARRLKLKNLPECSGFSGGQAIELMARSGNPLAFEHGPTMSQIPDCNFSFAGIKARFDRLITSEENRQNVRGGDILPNVSDVCASFQYQVLHHLAKRVQRGLLYAELKGFVPEQNKTLVLSGGVASNQFIRQGLEKICSYYNYTLVCPPPKLCTDNGIMIAWNGMEKYKVGRGFASRIEDIEIQPKCPIGDDQTEEVLSCKIKLPRIKLLS